MKGREPETLKLFSSLKSLPLPGMVATPLTPAGTGCKVKVTRASSWTARTLQGNPVCISLRKRIVRGQTHSSQAQPEKTILIKMLPWAADKMAQREEPAGRLITDAASP